jgi:hypothetical protein
MITGMRWIRGLSVQIRLILVIMVGAPGREGRIRSL